MIRDKNRKEIVLRAVRPNVGLRMAYRRRLLALVDAMRASYERFLLAAYKNNEPEMSLATDAMPAKALERALKKLAKQWGKQFDEAAESLAAYFAKASANRSDAQLKSILKKGGWTVKFKMTKPMRDVMAATINENVGLIRSIPEEFHTQVTGLVMRGVTAGRDLHVISEGLQKQLGVSKRRAETISRDQTAKMTASFTRVRQIELGVTDALWLHSGGGRSPRRSHVAKSGKRYNIKTGWYDPDVKKFIWPGELINCFPGSTRVQFAHNVEKAFRHFYSGELTEIITVSGKTLRATPNHPILTPHGWRPIGSLNECDDVVEIADETVDAVIQKSDVDHAIPLISEIFHAVGQRRQSHIALGDEFHGDVIANSDVDIVFPAWPLSFGSDAFDAESFKKFGLAVSNISRSGQRSLPQFFGAALYSAHSIMRSASEILSVFGRGTGHSYEHSFASASNLPTNSFDPSLNRLSLMPKIFGKREKALAGLMQRAQAVSIVRIERSSFSGHVFNLQTRGGYYSAEGIISHNCRCVSKPIVKGFS